MQRTVKPIEPDTRCLRSVNKNESCSECKKAKRCDLYGSYQYLVTRKKV